MLRLWGNEDKFYNEATLLIEWRMARLEGQDRRLIMTSVASGKPEGDGLNSGISEEGP